MKVFPRTVSLTLSALVLTALVITAVPVLAVEANTNQNSRDSVIQALIERFQLPEAEVEETIEAWKTRRQAEREAAFQEKLTSLVSDGSLTQAQADALKTKHQEHQAEREAARANHEFDRSNPPTQEEREAHRQEREEKRQEMIDWAASQGITEEILNQLKPTKGQRGPGGHHGSHRGGQAVSQPE